MFTINVHLSNEVEYLLAEIDLVCPTVIEADKAEDHIFYNASAFTGERVELLLVRVDPLTIRVNQIDRSMSWKDLLVKTPETEHLSYKEIIASRLPGCAWLEDLRLEKSSIAACIHVDVSTWERLDEVTKRAA